MQQLVSPDVLAYFDLGWSQQRKNGLLKRVVTLLCAFMAFCKLFDQNALKELVCDIPQNMGVLAVFTVVVFRRRAYEIQHELV
jgi:hypothetical protein